MLNRLFILAGVLVILAIAAAFVVPRFIQWGDYRERLEGMATQAFGAEVAITGDIQLTLLPQPKLEFTGVRVGPADAPLLEVAKVEAEVSLVDFIRDQYRVTRLTLDRPVVDLAIGPDGALVSGLALAPGAEQTNASVANATVNEGTIRIVDARSGETYVADAVDGDLRLDALNGPFSFGGTARVAGGTYRVRVSTGKVVSGNPTTLSLYLGADDGSFTIDSSGAVADGPVPKYTGSVTYRRPPPRPKSGEAADAGRGDLVVEGKVEASSSRLLLSNYTLTPDENRPATRLTGAADLSIGKVVAFNAVGSAGVIALPPRDATKELTDPPYELVRLLGEIPLPPIPGVAGKIGLDIAEINLRGVSLRNVRLDAHSDARTWTVDGFKASLPGETSVGVAGTLEVVDAHPVFAGSVTIDSKRLDLLAQLWRKPPPGNPLFNVPGSLNADVALSSDTLTLSAGQVVVDGINHGFDAEIGFGASRRLKVDSHLTTLGEEESAAMAALLPDVAGSGSFGATFPKGELNLSASKAVLFGLEATDLRVQGAWDGGVLQLSTLSAADYGGAAFEAKATAFGTLAKPELSGSAHVKVTDGAPALAVLMSAIGAPPAVGQFLGRSLPADLNLQLDAPAGDGGQALAVSGRLGTADATLQARLTAGIVSALTAPITAQLKLSSGSPSLMSAQLGLGDTPLFGDGTPLQLDVSIDGTPSNSYELHAVLRGGDDHLGFDGNVVPGDFTKITGDGDLDVSLSDPGSLVAALGGEGVYLPALSGRARLRFTGSDSLRLTDIVGDGVSGALELQRHDGTATVTGSVALASIDLRAFLPMLAGAAGSIAGDGVWPEGPIDIGNAPRTSQGRIDVTATAVTADGGPFATNASFGFDWDSTAVHLRNFAATVGDGTFTADIGVCCASTTLPAKQINGRMALNSVPLDGIVPPGIGAGLDGTVDAAAEFDGTGATLSEAVAAMTGSGSYTVTGFIAQNLDPHVFSTAAALTGVVDMEPDTLAGTISAALAAGPFSAPTVTGSFTVAGGVLRSPNLAIDGAGARLFGGATVNLSTLVLAARYAMTPLDPVDPTTALDPTSTEVAAVVSGPLWAPIGTYDTTAMVDGMKIKASEIELARLEKLQAEDEERQRLEAEERARISAEQAAAEASKASELSALQAAADAEASQLAAEQAASSSSLPPMDLGL